MTVSIKAGDNYAECIVGISDRNLLHHCNIKPLSTPQTKMT